MVLAGCSAKPDQALSAAGTTAANAATLATSVSITAATAAQRDLPILLKATGSVTPIASVEVRPQITTIVKTVHIRDGQFVRKDDLLFTLDSRTEEANVAKASAQLAKDEATLVDARRQLARNRELLAQNFVSRGALQTNQAQVQSLSALLAADRAEIDSARIALSFTLVKAPSDGRAGIVNVVVGSAVQAHTTPLVTITQLDPITVSFNLPQRYLADALSALKDGGAPVHVALPDTEMEVAGRLQFVDNTIDSASGTLKVKAQFDNRDGLLWPGAYVSVSLSVRTLKAAVVIPQASIVRNASGASVYVLDAGKAALRSIEVLAEQGDEAAVRGIRPGERVVLDGLQNLRPGVAVSEKLPKRDAASPAPSSASADGGDDKEPGHR